MKRVTEKVCKVELTVDLIVDMKADIIVKCLKQAGEFLGEDRRVCVAREITKLYEEFQRGTALEVAQHYEANPPKGEIVVVIEGKK